jgi:hypothetical protein
MMAAGTTLGPYKILAPLGAGVHRQKSTTPATGALDARWPSMLAGKRTFNGASSVATLQAILNEEPAPRMTEG